MDIKLVFIILPFCHFVFLDIAIYCPFCIATVFTIYFNISVCWLFNVCYEVSIMVFFKFFLSIISSTLHWNRIYEALSTSTKGVIQKSIYIKCLLLNWTAVKLPLPWNGCSGAWNQRDHCFLGVPKSPVFDGQARLNGRSNKITCFSPLLLWLCFFLCGCCTSNRVCYAEEKIYI